MFKKDIPRSESGRKEFIGLTCKLVDIMVDFCLLTLRTIHNKKNDPLNNTQIEEIINFDIQFRLQQIQSPEFLDTIRGIATEEFIKEQRDYKKLAKEIC